ncbi:UDP-4-amino-4,6-dideoxy-N-acetyl-beta-L-altrosamine N-acetyltransferase [Campylobacter lari]|uniref:UDP-4-amino-4, 6-dideoxy-N-acetyl-beta-L-altrosamine N-acetyltransferase n=1 Tax=Campylobacter lari TaxID=201 RepID=UPI001F09504D|nr:UDP-4-amino-4,6-dideoxy-N-acetyl-beta-L-altrosamine N-acetyltransferase [Campylobacter lari]MCH3693597.1 UDP-4-amino-4,6-dideoxy-N-acetyl-beta-L-altrosamine N-acetyltransferase [Campylobacter lari]MCH3695666.1 UDP-4-amino-4,6-dideoxy-N-acetyl-beta-L-altrosamine N-acetyltransferase [Campylobacter lari]MCH3701422.1 UDP-4-amino-4,6-dideoxy-N-acetyl-beta-L-altrosamine N-acetyltransferase [Campylobacter lari]MCH3702002.1 UDP-4-amino-4,6-dideoxy-N-acetyl-beta-L-altrosamine N-acetyltransferase [Cam
MIVYKDFANLDIDENKEILKIRNSENVSKFMKNSYISYEEHLNFIQKLKNTTTKKYFLICKENERLGVIYFTDISNNSCEFGLYGIKKGVGNLLMEEIKNYAFNVLKVKILKACVFKENTKALNLYLKHNFTIYSENDKFLFVNLNNPHKDIVF